MVIRFMLAQTKVFSDKMINMNNMRNVLEKAAKEKADFVTFPEMFNCPYDTGKFPEYAEDESGYCVRFVSELAREYKVYISAGSMPEKDEEGRVYNTAYVFDREGKIIAKHRKMHLFDINVRGGQYFKESDTLTAGNKVTVFDTEFGKMGLSICYDIRFPELYRLMADKGAGVILVPAAFNMTTGPKHWELLFKSRALDNQVFMVGTSSARDESSDYVSWGHSVVTSPWGEVMGEMDEKEGTMTVDLSLDEVTAVREQLPFLAHRRKDIYELKEKNLQQ